MCTCSEHDCRKKHTCAHMCTSRVCRHACTARSTPVPAPGEPVHETRVCIPAPSARVCAPSNACACAGGAYCACPCRHRVCICVMSPRAGVLAPCVCARPNWVMHMPACSMCVYSHRTPPPSTCLHSMSKPTLSSITPLPCAAFRNGCVARMRRESPDHWEDVLARKGTHTCH